MRCLLTLLAVAIGFGAAPVRFAIIDDRTGEAVPGVYEGIVDGNFILAAVLAFLYSVLWA